MKEEWRPVVGYEGLYEVSSFGNVKSLARTRQSGDKGYVKERILKFVKGRIKRKSTNTIEWYNTVGLYRGSGITMHRVHRLVAIAFIPNPENKPFINHIDGVKNNNHISNLEWCTNQENIKHSFKIGLQDNVGEHNSCSKLTEKQVLEIRKKYIPRKYTLEMLSKEYGVCISVIHNAITKRNWSHI